jgi:hypothetical protein
MLVPVHEVASYDIAEAYGPLLQALGSGDVKVGEAGNILKLQSLPEATGLVSGPPCPPWSTRGSQEMRLQSLLALLTAYRGMYIPEPWTIVSDLSF